MIETAYIDDLQIHPGTISLKSMSMGSPAPRAIADVRPNDHGVTDSTNYYGARSIELIGQVVASNKADMWAALDDLKGSLVLGSTHILKFRREGLDFDEQATVRVDSTVDVPLGPMPSAFLQFGVSLLAADPRFYTTTQSQGSYDPTDTGSGGLSFNLDFELDFNSSSGAQLSVDNEGNVNTPPVFVITGPVTNPIIDNDTTGQSIYTQGLELSTGDTIEIDTQSRTVLLGGTTARPDLIDVSQTDWFYLRPGVNLLRMRGTDMSSGETELAVTYRSARV
jgi:hypothetical protein